VTAHDTLPAGLTVRDVSPAACTVSGADVSCALGDLEPGEERVVAIDADVDPAWTDTLKNTASVAATSPDPDASDDRATTSTPVRPQADVRVTKLADPPAARAGEPLTYRIGVSNAGPSAATAVTLHDLLPDGFDATGASPDPECTLAGRALDCALGTLAPGASRTVTVTGAVDPRQIAALENTAAAATATADREPANDSATVTTPVAVSADLELTKAAAEDTVLAGTDGGWVLTLINRGPATATGVRLHDALPAGTTARAVTPQGACVASGRDVDCGFGDLAPGETRIVRVTAAVAADVEGELTNSATVASATDDPDASDDTAEATTRAVAQADLRIVKRALSDSVVSGADLTFRLRVINEGPSRAREVVVTDSLPDTLQAPIATTRPCAVGGRDLQCELGDLQPGEEIVLDITARVGPGVGPGDTISNTARVSALTADPRSANNVDTETVNSTTRADLEVTKTGPASANAGEPVSYSLTVRNAGPSDAADVDLIDTLPDTLRDAAFAPQAPECIVSARARRATSACWRRARPAPTR
jgi:uncharacterized repeat protein (TIGR01451 family)